MSTEPVAPAPAPWDWLTSGKPGSAGDFNLYVIDATGRKIAAVWGKRHEKEATAALLIAAPDLYEALARMLDAYWGSGDGHPEEPTCIIQTKAALAKAEGRASNQQQTEGTHGRYQPE